MEAGAFWSLADNTPAVAGGTKNKHDDMKIKQGWFQQNGDAQHSILYLQLETNHLPSVLLQGKALAKQSRLQELKISGVWPPFPVSDGRFGSSIQSPAQRGNKHVATAPLIPQLAGVEYLHFSYRSDASPEVLRGL